MEIFRSRVGLVVGALAVCLLAGLVIFSGGSAPSPSALHPAVAPFDPSAPTTTIVIHVPPVREPKPVTSLSVVCRAGLDGAYNMLRVVGYGRKLTDSERIILEQSIAKGNRVCSAAEFQYFQATALIPALKDPRQVSTPGT